VESATIRRAPPLPDLVRFGLIGALILLAVIAWTVTDERMAGMDAGPGTDPGELGWFVGIWVVMMAAMMFPSIAPMVLMHVRIQEGRRERGQDATIGATPLFIGGYLVAWAAAGLAAFGLFQLGDTISGDAFSWDNGGPYLAGGIIIAAAVYQLTPLKDVCLRHCRSPLMFLMTHWSPGRLGALRMGIEHGGFCVGCCWMLMGALFALGVMSLGWMAFIAALIAIEKLLPWRAVANRGIAVLLLVLGLSVAIEPENVPGLILPDSPEAMRAMEAMEGGSMEGEGSGGGGMEGMKEEGSGAGAGMEHESMGDEATGGGAGGMRDDGAMKHDGAKKDEGAVQHEGKGGTMPGEGMDHP
jgi:predicted metal-binding membrane protein